MSYVQDGSEQAAGLAASMVQSINSGNKDAVAKLADTLADVTAKQDAAAQATADWVTDYENQLDDFQKKMEGTVDSLDLSDEAGKAAKDTIAEYVQKLKDGKKDAVAAARMWPHLWLWPCRTALLPLFPRLPQRPSPDMLEARRTLKMCSLPVRMARS